MATRKTPSETFSAEEKAAMRDLAKERRARAKGKKVDGEAEVQAKFAELGEADRALAERVHEVVKKAAPELEPRTWYGMPAYAKDGKVVCFFQPAEKFKSRYSTLGFSDQAALDDGNMWPSAYALTKLTRADEKRITALVRQAVSG